MARTAYCRPITKLSLYTDGELVFSMGKYFKEKVEKFPFSSLSRNRFYTVSRDIFFITWYYTAALHTQS